MRLNFFFIISTKPTSTTSTTSSTNLPDEQNYALIQKKKDIIKQILATSTSFGRE